MATALAACLALLVLLGLFERVARDRAHAAVPIRVHVNGTRGKSTVTRLVHAALRQAGIPALAKVTGTTPRLLLPDGSERPVRRLAPANIREQLRLLRQARRLGARAVVAECMAVRPDLQWTSERDMLRATVGVVTNVRTDHTEVMGTTLGEIAASLANTMPRQAVLVLGDRRFADVFAPRARALGTRLVCADSEQDVCGAAGWLDDDRRLALAVTRELGIADEVALAGMALAAPDPGAARAGACDIDGRTLRWLDLTAANDPESLASLLAEHRLGPFDERALPIRQGILLVFNHRVDRPERLRRFASDSSAFQKVGRIILTGDCPCGTLWRTVTRSRAGRAVSFAPARRLPGELRAALDATMSGEVLTIVFCGNTRNFDRHTLLHLLSRRAA
jgi:poly-gamma-glutamate synthase PgsB/CapB